MANDNAVINYWEGEGAVLFQMRGHKDFSPSQVDSPKILPPPNMGSQKIVTVQCNNILSIRMLHRENPYERNFETIVHWTSKKGVNIYNIYKNQCFTK